MLWYTQCRNSSDFFRIRMFGCYYDIISDWVNLRNGNNLSMAVRSFRYWSLDKRVRSYRFISKRNTNDYNILHISNYVH
jgi:hypothetical protein